MTHGADPPEGGAPQPPPDLPAPAEDGPGAAPALPDAVSPDPVPPDPARAHPASADPAQPDPSPPAPAPPDPVPADPAPSDPAPAFDRRMLEYLVCPVTHAAMSYDPQRQELISRAVHLAFPIRNGIPILLTGEAREID